MCVSHFDEGWRWLASRLAFWVIDGNAVQPGACGFIHRNEVHRSEIITRRNLALANARENSEQQGLSDPCLILLSVQIYVSVLPYSDAFHLSKGELLRQLKNSKAIE
jgi:hypothetical protein